MLSMEDIYRNKEALVAAGENALLEKAMGSLSSRSQTFLEIAREDNPVLSFWPFAYGTAEMIADQAAGYERVGLLGTPTVFSLLKNRGRNQTILFEQDDYFSKQVLIAGGGGGGGGGGGIIKCDLASGVSESFRNQFDFVVGDPPWYLDEYCTWLGVAKQIVKSGGLVPFLFFRSGSETAQKRSVSILSNLQRKRLRMSPFISKY